MNGRDHMEDLDVDGRVSLETPYTYRSLYLPHCYASGYGTIVSCLEQGNDFPLFIKR
jgi:hypothetical protein